MVAASATVRTCCRCGEERPIADFRLKRRGNLQRRETACRTCHRHYMRQWRWDQRRKVLHRFCRRAAYQDLDRRFRALLVGALDRLGGVDALAEMLVTEIKTVRASRPGDAFPLHALTTIMRLHEYVEVRRQADEAAEHDEYRGLSSDQIKDRMRESIIDLIRKQPEIAIASAQILGWTVIPPEICCGSQVPGQH